MIWIKKPYKTINFKYGLSSTYKWYIKIKTIIFKNLYTVNLLTNNLIFKLNLEAKSEHSTSLKNDITYSQTLRDRNNHQRYSMKKVVLRNFAKFTGKHLCQSLFLNKIASLRSPCSKHAQNLKVKWLQLDSNYRVWNSETCTWHDKNIQSNAPYK